MTINAYTDIIWSIHLRLFGKSTSSMHFQPAPHFEQARIPISLLFSGAKTMLNSLNYSTANITG